MIKDLNHYDMSAERGFLCRHNAGDVTLSGDWAVAAKTALALPQILPSGRVRAHLKSHLPDGDIADQVKELTDAQARAAMVHYSFMVQSYVWGEPDAPTVMPRCLAMPMVALADRLGQQPLLPYSGYVLDNWDRLDRGGPIDLSNIYMIQNFLGGQDENWFVLVHVAIEARAGAVLAAMGPICAAAEQGDIDAVQSGLEDMASVWGDLKAIFDRMPDRCDPYVYFERVRPYIHGWKDNPALPDGIIYEGVEKYGDTPRAFRGQTGSQSSIVPSMDAFLGIGHAADPLRAFLDQLHIYRPPGHRAFIDDVRATSRLRDFISASGHKGLVNAYNANVQAVADFRSRHLEYAASYINKQSKNADGNDTDVGTGGTPFMKYLKKHRDETQANLLTV
ncbi:indoleamine 2,3-dioxygenase [Fretibacter rubidus]|uniref:indoleamine 2,3-dioxygenase n=1 Tax=Fretibacter rubidus TaxID=570162 RepID=UPI00352A5209